MNIAVIVIDMINDFITGKFENERAKDIIPYIKEIIATARSNEIPVIYVRDAHSKDDPEFDIWGSHAIIGSEGSKIIPDLKPEEDEPVLNKTKYSAFFDTELNSILRDFKVEEIVLTGVLTDVCIQHTAADAFFRGYNIIITRECVDSISEEENEGAIEFMEKMYDVEILDLRETIRKMES